MAVAGTMGSVVSPGPRRQLQTFLLISCLFGIVLFYISHQLTAETRKAAPENVDFSHVASNITQRMGSLRFVLTTVANKEYAHFTRNLACSLPNTPIMLLGLDEPVRRVKMPRNVHRVMVHQQQTSQDDTGNDFKQTSRRKLAAVAAVLSAGYDTLYTDVDVVWCDENGPKELASFVESVPGAHIVAQRAAIPKQLINTGVFYARAGQSAVDLLAEAVKFPEPGDDQRALNAVACESKFGGQLLYHAGSVKRCKWRNRTEVAFLPGQRFPLGCTPVDGKPLREQQSLAVKRICEIKRVALVHFTCWPRIYKQATMTSRGMWHVNKYSNTCMKRTKPKQM